MNKNVKIAKELVKIAKSLIARNKSLKSIYGDIEKKIEEEYPGEFSFYYHNGHRGDGYHSLTCKPQNYECATVIVSIEGNDENRIFYCIGSCPGWTKTFKCTNENDILKKFANAYEYATSNKTFVK